MPPAFFGSASTNFSHSVAPVSVNLLCAMLLAVGIYGSGLARIISFPMGDRVTKPLLPGITSSVLSVTPKRREFEYVPRMRWIWVRVRVCERNAERSRLSRLVSRRCSKR